MEKKVGSGITTIPDPRNTDVKGEYGVCSRLALVSLIVSGSLALIYLKGE
jgi:hypothetical protein